MYIVIYVYLTYILCRKFQSHYVVVAHLRSDFTLPFMFIVSQQCIALLGANNDDDCENNNYDDNSTIIVHYWCAE